MLQLKLLDSFSAYDVHASQQYLILRWRQSSFEIPLGGLGLHVLWYTIKTSVTKYHHDIGNTFRSRLPVITS